MMKRIIRLLIIIIICIVFFSNIFVSWNALNNRANQPPIADAGQDQNVDAGNIVNFDEFARDPGCRGIIEHLMNQKRRKDLASGINK